MPISDDTTLGENVVVHEPTNLWGCKIGADTRIGAYADIGRGVVIGRNCRIQAHAFIPPGVVIGDNVFIGPRVTFLNIRYPGKHGVNWTEYIEGIYVCDGAVIGGEVTIMCGVTIGDGAFIAARALVLKDVPTEMQARGYPAKLYPITHRRR